MRRTTSVEVTKGGRSYQVSIIEAPNIDDVVATEAQVQAYFIASGTSEPDRRVDRTIREFLLRQGVER
jgi:hypothetical protein